MFGNKGKLLVVAVLSLLLIGAVFAEQASAKRQFRTQPNINFALLYSVNGNFGVRATFHPASFHGEASDQRFVRFNYVWTQSARRPANSEFRSRSTSNLATIMQSVPGTWHLHVLATFTQHGFLHPERGVVRTVYRRGGPYVVR